MLRGDLLKTWNNHTLCLKAFLPCLFSLPLEPYGRLFIKTPALKLFQQAFLNYLPLKRLDRFLNLIVIDFYQVALLT